jgi:hypothetical protein
MKPIARDQFCYDPADPANFFFKSTYASTAEDDALFRQWTAALPERDASLPYHCGSPVVNKIRMVLAITGAKSVLEIGFNLGHTAMVWLNMGVERLVSVDISEHAKVAQGAAIVAAAFPDRFTFIRADSKKLMLGPDYELLFIDGGHTLDDVSADIALGKRLGVKWFFLDDFDEWHSRNGTQPAIAHHQLQPVALFPNMILCVDGDGWEKRA